MSMLETSKTFERLGSGHEEHQVLLPLPPENGLLSNIEIARRLSIPQSINPDLIALTYLCQPRGCSTATGAAWGDLPWLKGAVHFQPWKYLQRYGDKLDIQSLPLVTEEQSIVGLKETPGGPNYKSEYFDPVEIACTAGLPSESFRTIVTLRHPFWQLESILKFDTRRDPNIFLMGQDYLIGLYHKYIKSGIRVMPFCTEMYHGMDAQAMRASFTTLGLSPEKYPVPDTLGFGDAERQVVWHEADPRIDPHYYKTVVAPTIKPGVFAFPAPKPLSELSYIPKYVSPAAQRKLWVEAMPRYIRYAQASITELWQKAGFKNSWFEQDYLPQVISEAQMHGAVIN